MTSIGYQLLLAASLAVTVYIAVMVYETNRWLKEEQAKTLRLEETNENLKKQLYETNYELLQKEITIGSLKRALLEYETDEQLHSNKEVKK